MSSTRSEFSAGRRATKPSVDPTLQPAELKNDGFSSKRPSVGNRASRPSLVFWSRFASVSLPPWFGSPTATRPER